MLLRGRDPCDARSGGVVNVSDSGARARAWMRRVVVIHRPRSRTSVRCGVGQSHSPTHFAAFSNPAESARAPGSCGGGAHETPWVWMPDVPMVRLRGSLL